MGQKTKTPNKKKVKIKKKSIEKDSLICELRSKGEKGKAQRRSDTTAELEQSNKSENCSRLWNPQHSNTREGLKCFWTMSTEWGGGTAQYS